MNYYRAMNEDFGDDTDTATSIHSSDNQLDTLEYSHDEMRDLLVYIIQTLDSEFSAEVQNTNNPIGIIRSKVDRVLNK